MDAASAKAIRLLLPLELLVLPLVLLILLLLASAELARHSALQCCAALGWPRLQPSVAWRLLRHRNFSSPGLARANEVLASRGCAVCTQHQLNTRPLRGRLSATLFNVANLCRYELLSCCAHHRCVGATLQSQPSTSTDRFKDSLRSLQNGARKWTRTAFSLVKRGSCAATGKSSAALGAGNEKRPKFQAPRLGTRACEARRRRQTEAHVNSHESRV